MLSVVRRTNVAVAKQQSTPAVSKQVRCATRVGFWKKRRNLRNPHTRIRRPAMTQEDTRAQSFYMYVVHWNVELKKWRKQFEDMKMHKVTDYETLNQSVPLGRADKVVRAIRMHQLGVSPLDDHKLTMRDNPFMKGSSSWMFATETQQGEKDRGKLWAIMQQGKTMDEARKVKADMRAKYRAEKTKNKEGNFAKLIDWKMKGELGTHYDEMKKLTSIGDGDNSGAAQVATKPRRAMRFFDYDLDSSHKKTYSEPKDNISSKGFHLIVDNQRTQVFLEQLFLKMKSDKSGV
eukprot:TRINITY_DN5178_c0_g1_i1.p1 TRINITY_DN5178_c0_g1~~TRINITY_DN5178_c0_g1_i1.p1  ORF type:complete len:290 (+),score=42.68 TRINITY_DN5178_c0_g1_i1:42-911(+)